MTEVWRLLDTGVKSASENMALDDVLLEGVASKASPNTLRFLQFSKPCVLVGYHQDVDQEVRVDYCKSKKVEINRRLTGGGAIYFEPTHIGWEIIARWDSKKFPSKIEDLYKFICGIVANALRRLGLDAKYRPKNDIEVKGRKISGAGGTERKDAFLFQGTLLTDLNILEMLRCLRVPIEKLADKNVKSIRERVTTLKWELGYVPDLNALKEIIAKEMSTALRVKFRDQPLTSAEKALLKDRVAFFKSSDWIYAVKVPRRGFFHSRVKTPGGLIRVAVSVRENLIQAVYITGDFFAYPQTAVLELESRLKHLPLSEGEISSTVEDTLRKLNANLLGITATDIAKAIIQAATKIRFLDLKLAPEEADEIIEVLANAEEVLPKARHLLLPYCAKLISCSYRHREECKKCGNCDFGIVYENAEKLGFNPITIINYEHFETTLRELKEINEKAWIGSCCAQFYEKHIEDFEKIGLPGLIVTTEGLTCYDLGKEKQAYIGKYEGLSILRVKLLLKLLHTIKNKRSTIEV